MGWASYYENIVEKAVDLALFARPTALRFTNSAIEAAPPVVSSQIRVRTPFKGPNTVSIAERCRDMRDLHILCLSELRPKASERVHARSC